MKSTTKEQLLIAIGIAVISSIIAWGIESMLESGEARRDVRGGKSSYRGRR